MWLLSFGNIIVVLKAGYWNASNTSATVKVLLSNSDVSLIGGSVQIQAKADANNNFANVGASSTITSAEQTAGFKTMTLTCLLYTSPSPRD